MTPSLGKRNLRTRKRIEIEIHTERVLVVGPGRAFDATCTECGGRGRMLTIDEAARFAHLDSNAIHRLVEAGRLHFQLTAAGSLLICLASLWASVE